MKTKIPFIDIQAATQRIQPGLSEAINRVIEKGAFINGPEVLEVEEKLAAYCGIPHCLTVASGTEALHIIARALGWGKSDAIIVPAFTFPAAVEAILLVGAVPLLVDIDRDDFNIDPQTIADAVAQASKAGLTARAVVAVDLFGLPADYDALASVCMDNKLLLIGDAAQSFGARYKGRVSPGIADISLTSFYPAKPLSVMGDGGAIFCRDEGFYDIARSIRSHGCGSNPYDHVRLGLNGRFDTIQAAVLLEKLKVFDEELEKRQQVAQGYHKELKDIAGISLPKVSKDKLSSWAQYTLKVSGDETLGKKPRDNIKEKLLAAGYPTSIHYPKSINQHPAFASALIAPSGLKNSEAAAGEVISLPMHPYLEEVHQIAIAECLKS